MAYTQYKGDRMKSPLKQTKLFGPGGVYSNPRKGFWKRLKEEGVGSAIKGSFPGRVASTFVSEAKTLPKRIKGGGTV